MARHARRFSAPAAALQPVKRTRADWASSLRSPRAWLWSIANVATVAVIVVFLYLINYFLFHSSVGWTIALAFVGAPFAAEAQNAARKRISLQRGEGNAFT